MPKYLNPIAEISSPDSGDIVRPSHAYEFRKVHKFFCPDSDCLDKERILIPSKSKLGNFFFKHKADCKHEIRPQTLLHKLAVKWFEGKEEFEIPSLALTGKVLNKQELRIDPSKTQLEYRKLEKFIPDVKLTSTANFEVAIEIVVSNDIHEDKIKLIKQFCLPTIRVDLSQFYEENSENCRIDYDFVTANLDDLLTDIKHKSWAVIPKNSEIKGKLDLSEKSKVYNVAWIVGLVTVGLIYLLNKNKK